MLASAASLAQGSRRGAVRSDPVIGGDADRRGWVHGLGAFLALGTEVPVGVTAPAGAALGQRGLVNECHTRLSRRIKRVPWAVKTVETPRSTGRDHLRERRLASASENRNGPQSAFPQVTGRFRWLPRLDSNQQPSG
jgi:hypothetical protein